MTEKKKDIAKMLADMTGLAFYGSMALSIVSVFILLMVGIWRLIYFLIIGT